MSDEQTFTRDDMRKMMEVTLNEFPCIKDGLWGRVAQGIETSAEDQQVLFDYLMRMWFR